MKSHVNLSNIIKIAALLIAFCDLRGVNLEAVLHEAYCWVYSENYNNMRTKIKEILLDG